MHLKKIKFGRRYSKRGVWLVFDQPDDVETFSVGQEVGFARCVTKENDEFVIQKGWNKIFLAHGDLIYAYLYKNGEFKVFIPESILDIDFILKNKKD